MTGTLTFPDAADFITVVLSICQLVLLSVIVVQLARLLALIAGTMRELRRAVHSLKPRE